MSGIRLLLLALLAWCIALPAGAGTGPRYGGELVVAFPSAPGLDPAWATSPEDLLACAHIHQPPLGRGPDGSLVPVLLAELPHSDDGGRTFRLRLREGLRFHDGRPLGAADLAATIRRLADGPHAALVLPVAGTTVRSDTELEVRLDPAWPTWPEALAEPAFAVLPQTIAGGGTTVGAGPFRIAGGRWEAFADHAAGRPFLDAVRPSTMPDTRTAARALATGRAAIGPGGTRLSTLPRFATYLFVSPSLPGAPGIRAAANAALDRNDLLRWFVRGSASPLESLVPGLPSPARKTPGAAPDRTLTLLFDPAAEGHRQVAERIQLRLHDRGIEVRLEAVNGRELRARSAGARYELALVRLPLPADPGLAAATVLGASGRTPLARELLRLVPRTGLREAVARSDDRSGVVPLWAGAAPFGVGPGVALHGLPPPGTVTVPSLANAWTEAP